MACEQFGRGVPQTSRILDGCELGVCRSPEYGSCAGRNRRFRSGYFSWIMGSVVNNKSWIFVYELTTLYYLLSLTCQNYSSAIERLCIRVVRSYPNADSSAKGPSPYRATRVWRIVVVFGELLSRRLVKVRS